jgi:hypothetical protein
MLNSILNPKFFMVLGAMLIGGMVGHYAATRQFESMSAAQAQQAQLDQATQVAQDAQARADQIARHARMSNQGKKDPFKELEKIGNLKQQGLITEEEFQKLKARILSGI